MSSDRQETVSFPQPADAVFQALLGVVQNTKGTQILAAHNEGRILVFREKTMWSNPKIHVLAVKEQAGTSQLFASVETDPRGQKALMDGSMNQKSLNKLLEGVRAAVDGTAPVTATPVANHYLQKKNEIPWEDPEQPPDIELGGNFRAMYNL